jgi:hypothetical protein
MSCEVLKIKGCEISGSSFSGRKIAFTNRDITDDTFFAKVKSYNGAVLRDINGFKNLNTVYFSYNEMEDFKPTIYTIEIWADFKDLGIELIAIEEFKISSTPCDCRSTENAEITINFSNEIVNYELSVTGSKGAPFTYEDFTQEQINDLKKPAIDASFVAFEAAVNANEAADLASEKAGIANTAAINANAATTGANEATQNTLEAITNANAASDNANQAAESANLATEQTIEATENANVATGNALSATQGAITAAQSANTAAQVANSAKGWTPVFQFESDGDTRQVNKLVGYVGGTGDSPTDNIGNYVKENGYTAIKSEASNFKGSSGNLNAAGDINLSGAISKFENGMRVFNKVYQRQYQNVSQIGIVSFKFPQATSSAAMLDVTIKVYSYNTFLGKLRVSFYKSSAIAIVAGKAIIETTEGFPSIVLNVGIDVAGNICMNLGEITTNWGGYSHWEVERVQSSYTGANADWSKGWSQTTETVAPVVPDTYKSLINIVPDIVSTRTWTASQLASYVTQSSLNTQLGNYATLNSVQTFTNTKTFNQSPVIPSGTLSTHAVNLSQIASLYRSDFLKSTHINSVSTTLDSALPNGGFVSSVATALWGGTDRPSGASYGGCIRFSDGAYGNINSLDLYFNRGESAGDHRLWFRTKNGAGVKNWFEVYHSGNLNIFPSAQLITATTSTIAFDNLLMRITMQNGGTLNASSVLINQEIVVSNPSNTTLIINFTSLSLTYTLAAKSVATFEVLTGNKLLRRSVVENSTLLMN